MGYASQTNESIASNDPMPPDATCLAPTPQVDCDHAAITETASRLTAGLTDRAAKAAALHHYVRDDIRYGWAPAYDREPASRTLRRGLGFSKTKAVLMVALLRACGIPARIAMTDITSGILKGIVTLPFPWIDHALTEVWIDDGWVRTDSYIIDTPLLSAIKARLINDRQEFGYGVHRDGTGDWDGKSDSFVQWVTNGPEDSLSRRTPMPYPDLNTFNAFGEPHHRLGPIGRLAYRAFTGRANRKVEALRNETALALA